MKISVKFLFFLLIVGLSSEAKYHTTSYLSFELPPNWDCTPEGTEYVCSSTLVKGKKDAVIVFTAKERGPSDSLSAYEQHLKTPRLISDDNLKPTYSKVIKVVQNNINNHPWIDGLHDSSEIYNYYTRYLATVKDQLGILVTFSAHRNTYSKYSQDFDRAIRSLQVKKIPGTTQQPVSATPTSVGNPVILEREPVDLPEESGGNPMTRILGIALLLLAIIGYFLLRKK